MRAEPCRAEPRRAVSGRAALCYSYENRYVSSSTNYIDCTVYLIIFRLVVLTIY